MSRRLRTFLVPVVAAAVLAPAAGAATRPGGFARELLRQNLAGQFDRMYASLHPAQRQLIGQSRFMECRASSQASLAGATITRWRVTDTYTSTVPVPGTKVRARTTAVSFRLVLHMAGRSTPYASTMHLARIHGRWRWMLDTHAMRQMRSGRTC